MPDQAGVDALAGFESRHVATGLGRLHLRSAGSGPTLLFWPSLLMHGDMWHGQATHFRDRYRVVLVDPPGQGASEPLTRDFSFAECAACVVAILDALGVERAHFVGNSWGGMIGATFAALHPERVGVSVLMNATASPCSLRQKLEFAVLVRLVRAFGGVPRALYPIVLGAFLGPTSRELRPQVAAHIRAALPEVDGRSVHWAMRSVVPARPDQHALLQDIRTPVTVVAGAEDATFPVAETRAMAAAIPGACFHLLPDVAHLAGLEAPEQVNALIEKALADADAYSA